MFILNIFYALKSFFRYFNHIKGCSSYNCQYINEIQFSKLKNEIEYAWNNIPFYRKYWQKHGFNPQDFKTLDDISKIPFIDKNTIREYREEILNPNYPKYRLSLVTTGGTTGMPMKFYIDNYYARGKEMAFQIVKSKYYWGYKYFFDKVAIIRGFTVNQELIDKNIFWQRSNRDNGLVFSSFHITEENYSLYLKKLRSFNPKYIKAYPSSIVALCTLMKRHNDFGIKGLKAVICSSESIYDSHRELIKKTLGVEIYSFYGHSEKAVCAFQNGDKMIFEPFYGYTEFLNPKDDVPSKDGEIAQVVVTSLDNHYFPFIRYKTNDLVEVANIKDKTAYKIIGRSQEFIVDKNKNLIPFTCSDEIFWEFKGIVAYQYIQNVTGEININVQTDNRFDDKDLKKILLESKSMFPNFSITISKVDEIKKTRAGKFRYLIQNIKDL